MKKTILSARIFGSLLLVCCFLFLNGCSQKKTDTTTDKQPVKTDSSTVRKDTSSMKTDEKGGDYSNDIKEEMTDGIRDLKEMKMSGDINMDYADMLIRMNEAAVEIAEIQVKNGKTEEMRSMANKMVENHNKDISKLKNWKDNYKAKTGGAGNSSSLSQSVKNLETKVNASKLSNNVDTDFAELMKLNHLGAIELGQQYMKEGSDKDLKDFTKSMTESGSKEVKELDAWLSKK
jgi:uncharacterized protein (DUF305 family)